VSGFSRTGNADVVSGFSRTVCALALELVEGETLADRIARGSIPVEEALRIAPQIAEAFEAAHEPGIIHRDLKAANISTSHRCSKTRARSNVRYMYDVTADGQRFLVNSLPEQQESPRLELIVNWPALLRQ